MLATDDKYGWTVLSYCLCIFFILAFAFYGLIWAKFKLAGEMVKVGPCAPLHAMGTRLTSIQAQVQAGTAEMFTTGKGTQGMWRIGWSFFASAMGGWVITAPANFAVWGGWIAMMMYAIATGALHAPSHHPPHPCPCTFHCFVNESFGHFQRHDSHAVPNGNKE